MYLLIMIVCLLVNVLVLLRFAIYSVLAHISLFPRCFTLHVMHATLAIVLTVTLAIVFAMHSFMHCVNFHIQQIIFVF